MTLFVYLKRYLAWIREGTPIEEPNSTDPGLQDLLRERSQIQRRGTISTSVLLAICMASTLLVTAIDDPWLKSYFRWTMAISGVVTVIALNMAQSPWFFSRGYWREVYLHPPAQPTFGSENLMGPLVILGRLALFSLSVLVGLVVEKDLDILSLRSSSSARFWGSSFRVVMPFIYTGLVVCLFYFLVSLPLHLDQLHRRSPELVSRHGIGGEPLVQRAIYSVAVNFLLVVCVGLLQSPPAFVSG